MLRYFAYINSNVNKKEECHTPSDGVCMAAIMLAPKYSGTVQGIMGGVKDRTKCDQSTETTKAWAMDALKDFADPLFIVDQPDNIKEEDIVKCDPNDFAHIGITRDASWFINTWKTYVKPKFKIAIGKWEKDTGGGSSEDNEFLNFCLRDC